MKQVLLHLISSVCMIAMTAYTVEAQCLTAPVIACPSTYLGCPNDNLDPSNTGFATATPGDASCPMPTLTFSDVVITDTPCEKVIHRTWEASYPPGSASIKLHSTCQQTLLLDDLGAPVINNCPGNISIDLANNCSGIATWQIPTAVDDCGLAFFTTTHFSGSSFPLGNTTVTYTAQDMCGMQSTCSFNVNVFGSCCTGPSITCPSNFISCPGSSLDPSVTGMAIATVPDPSCPSATVTFNDVTISNNGACGMSIQRTWTATDGSSSVSCVHTVSNMDNQIPVISNFPSDMTLQGTGAGCSVVATWSQPVATDNCGVASFTSTHQSGNVFPQGSTLVTFTAQDNCGNQTTAAFQVTVTCTSPCSNPTITCPGTYTACPSSTVPSTAIAGMASASASSGCTSGTPSITFNDVINSSGPCAGQQQILRTFTATDAGNSNLTASCSQTINLIDNVSPSIFNVPSNITVSGTGAGCQVPVTWNLPQSTDNCGVASFTSNIQPGTLFTSGSTTVIYTSMDNCGNTNTASFTVTVSCSSPCSNPTITCPGTYTACPSSTIPSTSIAGMASASAGSGCTSGTPNITFNDIVNSSGPCFGQQQIFRTFTATDPGNSNMSASCTQTINLVDNVSPSIFNVPSNISVSGTGTGCQVPVTWNIPQSTDNCGVASFTSNIQSGALFTSGSTTVIYTSVDNCGNTNTASFTVTVNCNVPTCTTPPSISCPPSYTACPTPGPISPSVAGSATAISAGGPCGIPTVEFFDVVSNSGSCSGSRVIQRTWRATDPGSGLQSSCIQSINLIDNSPPFFTTNCPSAIVLTGNGSNCSAAATFTAPTASDNCSSVNLTATSNGQAVGSGSVFSQGTHLVTYTASDACGNASTCAFNVTVNCQTCVDNPFISCPQARNVCIGSSTSPSLLGVASATAGAFCPTPNVTFADIVSNSGSCAGAQIIQRTWTATYPNQTNLSASCIQMITLADLEQPQIINCPSNITVTSTSTPVTWVVPTATDNCGVSQITTTNQPGSTFPSGTTTVTYTAFDNCNNSASCSFNVTVNTPQGGFSSCPDNIVVQCSGSTGAVVTWPIPQYNGACGQCDQGAFIPGFIYMGTLNGSQYYCSLSPETWPTAKSIAQSHGGFLADITSPEENTFLANQLTIQSAWIGLNDYDNEGTFSWCSGAPVSYTNWFAGQPNNFNGTQDYVELLYDGQWNDQFNSYKLEYIMEIPCSFVSQTAGPAPGTRQPPGIYNVSYVVQDACGGFATCDFTVTVESSLTITCPDDIVVSAPSSAGVAVTWDDPTINSCCSNCTNAGGQIPGFLFMGSFNGSHYYCSLTGLDWTSAQQNAINNGGHLAVINSQAENDFIKNIIPLSSAWIGLSDLASEGNFQWVNGDPLVYTNWYPGQPNNFNNGQHTVELLNTGEWNDQYPDLKLEYVMEVSGCLSVTQTAGPTSGSVLTPGTHVVSYTAQDGCGNVETCSFNITVGGPSTGGGNFCSSGGVNSQNSHIKAFGFNTISNTSGNNGGYADFTSQCTTVAAGVSHPLQLTPGFGGASPQKAFWTVWIDYNQDGDFNDNFEFVAYGCGTKTLSGTITVPYGVWNGTTRLRVTMSLGGYVTDPCAVYPYGETEDYCVTVTGADFAPGDKDDLTLRQDPRSSAVELTAIQGNEGITLFPNPVNETLTINIENSADITDLRIINLAGQVVSVIKQVEDSMTYNAIDLDNGIYLLRATTATGDVITEKIIVQH